MTRPDGPPGRNGRAGPLARRDRPPTLAAAKRRESAPSLTGDGHAGAAARRELARRGARPGWTVAA